MIRSTWRSMPQARSNWCDGHRRQLLADEVEELGGVLTGARVDVDDEGAVVAADDREVADAELAPADAGGGGADGAERASDRAVPVVGRSGGHLELQRQDWRRTVATYSDRARGESEEVMGSS